MTAPLPVCVTEQFDTPGGGILALGHSAMARVVANTVAFTVGDGDINGPLTSTGKLILDARAHWNSTYAAPVTVVPFIQRRRNTFKANLGNTLHTRERYTVAVGVDSTSTILAPEPTTDPTWDTEAGGGVVGAGTTGAFYLSTPESSATLAQYTVQPGQAIDVRYRMTGFTAFTGGSWAAGNNSIYAFFLVIKLLVLPENMSA